MRRTMTFATGTYKKRKIYLDRKLNLKDNAKVKVNILDGSWIDKYFGIMKNKFKGDSLRFINKLRRSRF